MFVLEQIHPEKVEDLWPQLEKKWEAVPELWQRVETLDFVKCTLEQGLRQLWVLKKGEEVVATMVTQIVRRQVCNIFQVIMAEGGDLKDMLTFVDAIKRLAAQMNCEWVEVQGRAGWCKVLKEHGFFECYRVCAMRTNLHREGVVQ